MTPRSTAIRRLMASPAVREASPIVRNWLHALLLRGEKSRGASGPARPRRTPGKQVAGLKSIKFTGG
jgi:hypothetical protein